MLAALLVPVLYGRKYLRHRGKKKKWKPEQEYEKVYENYREEVATKQQMGLLTMHPNLLKSGYAFFPPIQQIDKRKVRRNTKLLTDMVEAVDRSRARKRRDEEELITILLH